MVPKQRKIAPAKFKGWTFWIGALALLSAIILSLLHSLDLCTSACAEGSKWRFLGLKFETIGLIVLPLILGAHILSLWIPVFRTLTPLAIAGCLGGELWFLYIQKMVIGSFCPICVGIAFSLFIAAAAYATRFFKESFQSRNEDTMHNWTKILPSMSMMIAGFLLAFFGVVKTNPLEAQQQSLKDNIRFGKDSGSIEVYVFTDWFCPACRKADPEIDKMMPDVLQKAKLFFVDAAVHPESLNFTPYNLSFMINNKDKYLEIKKAILNLADTNNSPSEADIKKTVEPIGITLKEVNYSDVASGVKLFKKLVKQFEVTQTPTVVIINMTTKKGKKLTGSAEITKDNVMRAIDSLQ